MLNKYYPILDMYFVSIPISDITCACSFIENIYMHRTHVINLRSVVAEVYYTCT